MKVKALVDNALQLGLPEGRLPLAQAVVLLAADGSIITGKFILQDGSAVFVKVKSLKKTEERNSSFFSPSRKFGSDWVVTDLR